MRPRRPPRPRMTNRGEGLDDAAVVGDLAVFDGDVEVDAHEDAFGFGVNVGDSLLGHGNLLWGRCYEAWAACQGLM